MKIAVNPITLPTAMQTIITVDIPEELVSALLIFVTATELLNTVKPEACSLVAIADDTF